MSIRDFIAAVPKVELNLQLTGAFRRESLLMIAHQNGVPAQREGFDQWIELLDRPDYARLDEIAREAGSWVMYPEDIALVVYDMGLALSKQNVHYAEVAVAPPDFIGSARMNFDAFLDALNDGRDRVLRAWNVELSWILCIPWDNPRSGDDVARWATGHAAQLGNVVGMGLIGLEGAQPVGQFRRAFDTARKKGIYTVVNAGSSLGVQGIDAAVAELLPHRLTDSWGIAGHSPTRDMLAENGIPIVVSLHRAQRLGLIKSASDYPLRQLLDSGLRVLLSSGMPSLLGASLIDEYELARTACGLDIDSLIQLMRQSIELSFLDSERKEKLLLRFDREVKTARRTLLTGD